MLIAVSGGDSLKGRSGGSQDSDPKFGMQDNHTAPLSLLKYKKSKSVTRRLYADSDTPPPTSSSSSSLSSSTSAPSRSPPTNRATDEDTYTRILNQSLDFTRNIPGSSSSRTSRAAAPGSGRNPLSDLAGAFSQRSNVSDSPSKSHTMDLDRMLNPLGTSSSPPSLPANTYKPPPRAPMRLGPSVGRSIPLNTQGGMDLGRALRMLDILCAKNKVRADFGRQRFHERGGLKRKRLHSERWRRRFKAGFTAVVKRVEELRRKGW
ncbi:hypothetical protein B0A49_09238 [Cryomyces minteri]|uniref:Ribosomal protein S21 n=1 Tax=Cryomyces minteri TaxID=331657 RepID=A0A4U0WVE1_9PEZI|nr:hypothetical protein B0A49_09238 [Cryomyces minteri]